MDLPMGTGGGSDRVRAMRIEQAVADCYRCATVLLDAVKQVYEPARSVASGGSAGADKAALPPEIVARMDRQIDAQPAWREHPMPPALRSPLKPSKRITGGLGLFGDQKPAGRPPKWTDRLPPGELVRVERDGARIVAITASQSLDPAGEVGSGGYWLSLSGDGGKSFAAPLYMGLRVFGPYTIRPESNLPLLAADTLQIEVLLRRIDPEKIMFPPIALPIAESRDDIYLTLPLADLRRDTDGDGLTDLAEQAMLLDPDCDDTDGDGLEDGVDSLP